MSKINKETIKKLGEEPNLGKGLQSIFIRNLNNLTDDLRERIYMDKTVSTGFLAASNAVIPLNTNPMKLRFGVETAEYYKEVDKGQEPTLVPFENLLEWVRNKGLGTNEKLTQNKTIQQIQSGIAQRTQNAIKARGTIKRFNYEGSEFWTELVGNDMNGNISKMYNEVEIYLNKNII